MGAIPPLAPGYGEWQTIGSDFLGLVESAQGDAGDPSDGFEAAFAVVSAAVDSLGNDLANADSMVDGISDAADDFDSIQDTLTDELLAGQGAYDSAVYDLTAAMSALSELPAMPFTLSVPELPTFLAIPWPDAIDVLALAEEFTIETADTLLYEMDNMMQDFETSIMAMLG